ncbi:MAG: TRAP transporter small permease, partial [Roseinatronobacter sp.]
MPEVDNKSIIWLTQEKYRYFMTRRRRTIMQNDFQSAPGRVLPGGKARGLLVRLERGAYASSRRVASVEVWIAGLLVLAVFCLMMANVISRAASRPLIWSDELAIYLMACATFIGASVGLAHRRHIAVTLLPDLMPERTARGLMLLVDGVLLLFFGFFAVLLWRWFDPVNVLRAESL